MVTARELDQVTALLEQVLPDPMGFTQRLLEQAVERWSPEAALLMPDTGLGPIVPGEVAVGEGEALACGPLVAAALGACACYGQLADCPRCLGDGLPGWQMPDRELYELFVVPAATRMHADPTASDQRTRERTHS